MKARRHGPGHGNHWDRAIRELRGEKFGTELARHHMEGNLTAAQKSAGDHYAVLTRRFDRFFGFTRRYTRGIAFDSPSPDLAYDGVNGQTDEVARHERYGTIKEYERRAKKIKEEWKRAQEALDKSGGREVVDRACIYDQPIPPDQHPILAGALEHLARVFGFNAKGDGPRRASTWHQPGARLGSKGK
jgi:hypothetical protein